MCLQDKISFLKNKYKTEIIKSNCYNNNFKVTMELALSGKDYLCAVNNFSHSNKNINKKHVKISDRRQRSIKWSLKSMPWHHWLVVPSFLMLKVKTEIKYTLNNFSIKLILIKIWYITGWMITFFSILKY